MTEQPLDESFEQILALTNECSDAERHVLRAESKDWKNLIEPAIVAFGNWLPLGLDTIPYETYQTLTVIYEAIYTLGYRRGKEEVQKQEWVVCEAEEPDQ